MDEEAAECKSALSLSANAICWQNPSDTHSRSRGQCTDQGMSALPNRRPSGPGARREGRPVQFRSNAAPDGGGHADGAWRAERRPRAALGQSRRGHMKVRGAGKANPHPFPLLLPRISTPHSQHDVQEQLGDSTLRFKGVRAKAFRIDQGPLCSSHRRLVQCSSS